MSLQHPVRCMCDECAPCVRCKQDALGRKATIVGIRHTCGQQPSEAEPALPVEVEESLESLLTMVHAFSDFGRKAGVRFLYNTFRHHFQKLTAERDALAARVGTLEDVSKAKSATIRALCDTADGVERRARLDALNEVWNSIKDGEVDTDWLWCERARLEQPPPSEAASGQEGRG